ALEAFPGLIESLDDVVFDAEILGARNELADDLRLHDAAGIGELQIVAGARPAELGDYDALARIIEPQALVFSDRIVNDMLLRHAFPVGKDVDGDEIDGRGEFRVIAPRAPDFAGGHRHRDFAFHAFDDVDQLVDTELVPEDRFVTDDDRADVPVLARELDRVLDLTFVALRIFIDPRADGDPDAELGGNGGHELKPARGRVGPDRPRVRRDHLQVSTDLLLGGAGAAVRLVAGVERRKGEAVELAVDYRRGRALAH